MEYTTLKTESLTRFDRRDVRTDVLEKLKQRIKEQGYNPARPLTVIQNGVNLVADGNHRLEALQELGIEEVPCVIREGNEYKISIECNMDEDTYAPEDLFDRLQTIQQLKEEGFTQREIGEIVGMSESSVKQYGALSKNIVTDIIDQCKSHQKGRVTDKVTNVTFDFTEGWFRNSGLYDLNGFYQDKLMTAFIDDKFNWSKSKLQSTSEKYKLWMDMEDAAEEELHDQQLLGDITKMIRNGTFQSMNQLRRKIEDLNKDAKNKLINGDCLIELGKLDDASIDVVVTDPPYGMDYVSNRSKYNNHVTKEGVENDDESAFELFDDVCKALDQKTKEDAHLYFFINWNNFHRFREIASKYFTIKTPIVWNKGNMGPGDLKYDWGNGTELIIYCTKGKKPINKRRINVLEYSRLNSSKMIHPTQKPEELIKEILSVSANKHDVFCDPFMGSGSHIKAAKRHGCNYIGIELDKPTYDKAKSFIGD